MTIDDLAGILQQEFCDIRKEMSDGFASVDKRFDGVDRRLDNLEVGQEEIKSVMSQAATKTDVKLLDRRVTKIEQKVGLV